MPSCVFRKCTNYTASVKDTTGVSFHSLPRDGEMKQKWVNVIRHQRLEFDWMPTHYTTICSKHFEPEDMYLTGKNIRRLKKTAVPIIELVEVCESEEKQAKDEHNMLLPCNLVKVTLEVEDSADEKSFKSTMLKSKIRRMSLATKKLKSKNYELVRRNNRLSKKCNDLIKIVHRLRRKLSKCECDEK